MAEYTRQRKRARWVGTPDVLLEAAAAARKEVTSWIGADPTIAVTVKTTGQTIKPDSLDDLQKVFDRNLPEIGEIDLKIGDYRSPAEVTINLASSYAAVAHKVTGEDEDEVRGLSAHLAEILTANQRVPPWYSRNGFAFVAGCITVFGGAGVFALLDKDPGEGSDVPLPFYVAWGATGVLVALLWLLSPNLELLGPGNDARLRRFRTAAVGVVVALIVGVVATILADPFTN
ncbi:MAG: hypothetical protein AABM66_07180 [Actinomycetota bacterium]